MTEPTIQKQEVSVTDETVMSQIYMIRGQKVMLDRDLAKLYGVETFRLNEQVNEIYRGSLKISCFN